MFACKECIVLASCSQFCDKVTKRSRLSTSDLLTKNICPDCGTNNKFNVKQSFVKYDIKCVYCNHIFSMMATNFVERK